MERRNFIKTARTVHAAIRGSPFYRPSGSLKLKRMEKRILARIPIIPIPPTTPKLKFTRAGCGVAETTRRGVKPTISILKPSPERATRWNNSSGTLSRGRAGTRDRPMVGCRFSDTTFGIFEPFPDTAGRRRMTSVQAAVTSFGQPN